MRSSGMGSPFAPALGSWLPPIDGQDTGGTGRRPLMAAAVKP